MVTRAILAGAVVAAALAAETNVLYGMYSDLALLLDVHRPEKPNGYGIILIAGSGWTAPLAAAGYTLFAVNHRAAPRFHYPAAVEDVQRAVRFVRRHAARWGLRPDRIGATGGSSGGHLVEMLGLSTARATPTIRTR